MVISTQAAVGFRFWLLWHVPFSPWKYIHTYIHTCVCVYIYSYIYTHIFSKWMLFLITVSPFPWHCGRLCCCWQGRSFERSCPLSTLRVEKRWEIFVLSECLGPEWLMKVNSVLIIWTFSLDINTTEEQVLEEIINHVRQSIGPVAAFRNAVFVKQLPKTRSGKIPRSALSALVNGKPYKVNYQKCLMPVSEIFLPTSLALTFF